MFAGRYQLGQEATLFVQSTNGTHAPSEPTAAPTARVYKASDGSLVVSQKLPIADKFGKLWAFSYPLFLDGSYSANEDYLVVYSYTVGTTTYQKLAVFSTMAGGDARGQVVAMYAYRRPTALNLVHQLADGNIKRGRNPRL